MACGRAFWQGERMRRSPRLAAPLALAILLAGPAVAEDPVILDADASRAGGGWRISVTLSHPDTGWDHYADGWEVLGPDGARLGYRELLHPHVDEQPFTRSLGGVTIPDGVRKITVRAHCNTTGWAEESLTITLDR